MVMERARNMVVDWQLANTPAVLASCSQHQPSPPLDGGASTSFSHDLKRWEHPMPGRYKCSIGIAFSSPLNRIGIGICVRDSWYLCSGQDSYLSLSSFD